MSKCCVEGCNKTKYKTSHRCEFHYKEYRNAWYKKHQQKLRERYRPKDFSLDRKPRRRYLKAIASSKRRGLEWNISYDDWLSLINDKCYYDGQDLPVCGSGLDRKDNKIGYIIDNVVPCCYDCNRTKLDRFSCEEFKIMMDALLEWKKKKN